MPARSTAKASAKGLEKIKQAIARKGWRKTSPAFVDAACVSTATLKRFWRGVPVSKESFASICQAVGAMVEEIIEPEISSALSSFEASDRERQKKERSPEERPKEERLTEEKPKEVSVVSNKLKKLICKDPQNIFVCRPVAIRCLETLLESSTRILTLIGLTGAGKTAIAQFIASELEDYVYIHLRCHHNNPPALASLFHKLSQRENFSSVTISMPHLLDQVIKNKYLIVIDGLENLLKSDKITGYSSLENRLWQAFFRAVLSIDSCNSRFILTSRTLPNELDELGEQHPNRWSIQILSGLEAEEQRTLFQQLNVVAAPHSANAGYLSQLAHAYAGHPTALRAIAQDITTTFSGNITAYWNEYQQQSTVAPLHTRYLRRRLQPNLKRTLQQLKAQMPIAHSLLRTACQTYSNTDSKGQLNHRWMQLAQTILTQTKVPQTASDPHHAAVWIDALCDRNLLIPTIHNNRLHYRIHPLVHSFLIAAPYPLRNYTGSHTEYKK